MKKMISVITALCVIMTHTIFANAQEQVIVAPELVVKQEPIIAYSKLISPTKNLSKEIYEDDLQTKFLRNSPEEYSLTSEEIDLLAKITMAEAGNQSDIGKRLVIDSVLNRIDSEYFPDSVEEVIYQPNQYSPVSNGSLDRSTVDPHIVDLVKEELHSRYNSEVIFFRTKRYSDYGVPMFKKGDHYFSSYQ